MSRVVGRVHDVNYSYGIYLTRFDWMVSCEWMETLSLQNHINKYVLLHHINKYVLLHHIIVLKRAGKQERGKIMKQMKTSVAKQKLWQQKDEQAGVFGREVGAQQ